MPERGGVTVSMTEVVRHLIRWLAPKVGMTVIDEYQAERLRAELNALVKSARLRHRKVALLAQLCAAAVPTGKELEVLE